MGKFDKRGNPISHGDQRAIDALDHAFDLLHAYQADALAEVDTIVLEHPDFAMAHAFRAGALATATDKAFEAELINSVQAAEALAPRANDRERMHISAVRAWLDGDWQGRSNCGAARRWPLRAICWPRNLRMSATSSSATRTCCAIGLHVSCRTGTAACRATASSRACMRSASKSPATTPRPRHAGLAAVALNGQDGWAVHAVAHVMEMQGRAAEGADFLAAGADAWAPNSLLAYHLWWHKALFHLDADDAACALHLFDEKISAAGFAQALELLDGSSLLWRLSLLGHDVGERWNGLADKWQTRIDDAHYAFNDVNAMMAFVGAGNSAAQQRQVDTVTRAAAGATTNSMMSREIGVPACEGVAAFGRGDYAQAIEWLLPLRAKANRFGGSHAQRDMFSWTLTEAAIRLGDRALAEAFIAERLAWKPKSPINVAWATRTAKLQAAHAR